MPSYKLTYFDARGRAECLRLLFAFAGVEYEDVRIQREEWPALKESGRPPFGQLPMLEVDDKPTAQTNAMANYLAREFGLYGSNNWESLQIDMVVCQVEDFRMAGSKMFYEKDEEKKKELTKKFREEDTPRYAATLVKLLKANGGNYFVGDKITLADIIVYDFLYSLSVHHPGVIDNYPELKAVLESVGNIPKIKAYVDSRKQTQF